MEIPCDQESPETLIQKFINVVDREYSRQSSSQTHPTWPQIHSLASLFMRFQNITITGQKQQIIFIDSVMKYVELVMWFLTGHSDTQYYRKQISYAFKCLTFIPGMFDEVEFCNVFVKSATAQVIDLLTYGDFSLVSKRELLTLYNSIAIHSRKQVRVELSKTLINLMFPLVDSLSTYGDYVIQSDIMETLFRIFGTQLLNKEEIAHEVLPGSEELGNALKTDISIEHFDADVRRWLNKLNENSNLIFTIACKKVMFGNHECVPAEALDVTWVDFNLKDNERMFGFYSQGSTQHSWNRITILARDVKKIEVDRPLRGGDVTLSLRLSKSCICSALDMQEYFNKLEKHVQLVLENKDKDNTTKLISTVLPHVFGDTFSHGSTKIAIPRNVYKPLPLKISKRKMSSVSNVSIATSPSRSKSDEVSIEVAKISKSGTTLKGVAGVTSPNVSESSEAAFTRHSFRSTLDRGSIIASENSNTFPSSRPTSPMKSDPHRSYRKKADPKVQDDIVTSSDVVGESSEKIEILSGRCSGRSFDYSKDIRETFRFQSSEVFSSSPVKISEQQKYPRNISSVFSEDAEEPDDRTSQNKNVQGPKISIASTQEEDFETAVEDMAMEQTIEDSKDNGNERTRKNEAPRINQEDKKKLDEINVGASDSRGDIDNTKKIVEAWKEVVQTQNSEDVFNVPTQEFFVRNNRDTEQFADESLAVNVGISDNQCSEDVQVSGQEVSKIVGKPGAEKNKVKVSTAKQRKKEENKENVIDLTLERDDDDSDNEKGQVKAKQKLTAQNKKKGNLGKRTLTQNKPLQNMPGFVVTLDRVSPLNECLSDQKKNEDPTVDNVPLIAAKKNFKKQRYVKIKDNYAVKQTPVIKEKSKTENKKLRTLIKTGTKRFELEHREEIGHIQDDTNAKDLLEQDVEEHQKTINAGATSKNNSNEASLTKEIIDEDILTVSQKQRLVSNVTHMKVIIPKLNMENKDGKSNSRQEIQLLNVVQKEPEVTVLDAAIFPQDQPLEEASSNSESELASEINIENVDYLDTFNQLKMLEENKSSNLIQKKTNPGIPKSTDTTKDIVTKDQNSDDEDAGLDNIIVDNDDIVDKMRKEEDDNKLLSSFILRKSERRRTRLHSDEVEDAGMDSIIVDNNDIVDKMTEEEDDDDNKPLSSFILKKSARPLAGSSDFHVTGDLENEINNAVNTTTTEHTTLPQNEKNDGKISSLVTKGKGRKQLKPKRKVKGNRNIKLEVLKEVNSKIDKDMSNQKDTEADLDVSVSVKNNIEISDKGGSEEMNQNPLAESQKKQIEETVDNRQINKHEVQKQKEIPKDLSFPDNYDDLQLSPQTTKQKIFPKELDKLEQNPISPIITRTKSNENVKRPSTYELEHILREDSPNDFDTLLKKENSLHDAFNYSKINCTVGNRSRKLYNQGNYSYLDDLPDITEQNSPDLDETPIPLVKGTKPPKQRKTRSKKATKKTVVDQPTPPKDKTPKPSKRKSPKDGPSKLRTRAQPKRAKVKEFSINTTTDFASLSDLFNKTFRSPEFGSFNYMQRPLDIVARFAHDDESHVVVKKPRNEKNTSIELPNNIEVPTTPPTPTYSFPDLEVEPFYKKADPPRNKINILQDVVIKPKRPSRELTNENNKRRKVEQENENIPLPPLPEDAEVEMDATDTNRRPEEARSNEGDAIIEGLLGVFKYIVTILETRHRPDTLEKIKHLMDNVKENYKI